MRKEERIMNAKDTWFFINAITEKYLNKILYKKEHPQIVKIMINDGNHPYNKICMDMVKRTFLRRNLNVKLDKFKVLQSKRFGYIFSISRI